MSTGLIEQTAGKGAAKYAARRAAQGKPIQLKTQSHNPANRRPKALTYILLAIVVLISIFPLYAALIYGSSSNMEIGQASGTLPRWIPSLQLFENFGEIVNHPQFNFWVAFGNSTLVAGITAAAQVLFATLAGFAFAKLQFAGKNGFYVFIIATMAIPMQIGTIPMFIMMANFGWIDSLLSVTVPGLVGAFGVFWMTQYLTEALPYELIEASRVDGASMIRTFWSIVMPAARPAAATLALFTFVGSWNSFFWPSIMLRSREVLTLPLVIPMLRGAFTQNIPLVLTGVFLVALPLLLVFIFLGKQLVAGVMAGAVKG
ncbi:MAG: carbohydrate ABC transporter permease [Cellulomonadaceae bacterium]|jgi:cellobiose transport system permease protein|nr:carbohydrate ABC transporter permease [Cellulomonadaceae bacterium]